MLLAVHDAILLLEAALYEAQRSTTKYTREQNKFANDQPQETGDQTGNRHKRTATYGGERDATRRADEAVGVPLALADLQIAT
jgi:hypothetical protein